MTIACVVKQVPKSDTERLSGLDMIGNAKPDDNVKCADQGMIGRVKYKRAADIDNQ